MITQEIIERYNIVINYCQNQCDAEWRNMLFLALVHESLERSPQEKKKIASVLEILK